MAPKLWRQSYGAKGMHAFIDYHRFGICYHQMSCACGKVMVCDHAPPRQDKIIYLQQHPLGG